MIVRFCSVALVLCAVTLSAIAESFRLPSVFSSHMVLQREVPIPVWGWDMPGQEVRVELSNKIIHDRRQGWPLERGNSGPGHGDPTA